MCSYIIKSLFHVFNDNTFFLWFLRAKTISIGGKKKFFSKLPTYYINCKITLVKRFFNLFCLFYLF